MQTYQIKIETDRAAEIEMFLAIMKALHFVVEVQSVQEEDSPQKTPVSKFRGILPKQDMEEIDRNIADMRNEWEGNI